MKYNGTDLIQYQDKQVLFNLGFDLLKTGKNIEAIEAFQLAIRLDNFFVPAWGNIGIAFMNQGMFNDALSAMKRVLILDPENTSALLNLSTIIVGIAAIAGTIGTEI